jgi:DNA invertase Pin-like site-specific DNA recombinase
LGHGRFRPHREKRVQRGSLFDGQRSDQGFMDYPFAALAGLMHREFVKERTMAGLVAAAARGRQGGR